MNHSDFHGPVHITVEGEVPPVLPEYTTLSNAYPNPFRMNGTTNITATVKAGETGTVTIYNVLGQTVKTFTIHQGNNPISWNGVDSKGKLCGSGIYFYKLSTPSVNITKKMVIIK
ncbi:MAG: T9SS type A sorting domain-containing protein [Candidatus Cloacimonadaceae bacterium]|nr:T9SS type A sorting domain-containing protein [Candidatus Cloacimonadaceae bacterium]